MMVVVYWFLNALLFTWLAAMRCNNPRILRVLRPLFHTTMRARARHAASSSRPVQLRALLTALKDATTGGSYGEARVHQTASMCLVLALNRADAESVNVSVEHGADVEYENGLPMFTCIKSGHVGTLRLLLKLGARRGRDHAVFHAVETDNVDMIRELLVDVTDASIPEWLPWSATVLGKSRVAAFLARERNIVPTSTCLRELARHQSPQTVVTCVASLIEVVADARRVIDPVIETMEHRGRKHQFIREFQRVFVDPVIEDALSVARLRCIHGAHVSILQRIASHLLNDNATDPRNKIVQRVIAMACGEKQRGASPRD